NGCGQPGHGQAVPQRGNERRRREVACIVGEADEASAGVLKTREQQRGEGQGDKDEQDRDEHQDASAHDQVFAGPPPRPGQRCGRDRHAGAPRSKTRKLSGGNATVKVWPTRMSRSRTALTEKSERSSRSGSCAGRSVARQKAPRKSSKVTVT